MWNLNNTLGLEDTEYHPDTLNINVNHVVYTCYILTLAPAQKCYSKVIHRKEVTHFNGQ